MASIDIGRNHRRTAALIAALAVLLAFAIGVIGFARAISVTTLGGRALSRVVVVALIVMAISRFIPLAAVQFYVQGVAAIVALAAGLRDADAAGALHRGPIATHADRLTSIIGAVPAAP